MPQLNFEVGILLSANSEIKRTKYDFPPLFLLIVSFDFYINHFEGAYFMKRMLTERELEVAIYVAKGFTDVEISKKYMLPLEEFQR